MMRRFGTHFSLLVLIALVGCGTSDQVVGDQEAQDVGDQEVDQHEDLPQKCCIDCFGSESCHDGEVWTNPAGGGMCGDCDYIATLSCGEPYLTYTCSEGCAPNTPCSVFPGATDPSLWCAEIQAEGLTVQCTDESGCIDLQTNPAHCGSCDTACASTMQCMDGQCVCSDGLGACGELCLDLQDDLANCGACGQACGGGESCTEGVCTCPAENQCGAGCIDVNGNDFQNCGACGHACAAGELCAEGVCAVCNPFVVVDHSPTTYDESVAPGTAIELSFSCDVAPPDSAAVVVHSTLRGRVAGVFFQPSAHTLRFVPDTPFLPGDLVSVSATAQLRSAENVPLDPYVWRFRAQAQGGSGTFTPAPNGPKILESVALGDVDGDGDLDLVVAGVPPVMMRNLGGGVFSSPPDMYSNHAWLGLVDVDNDGDLDLLFAEQLDNELVDNGLVFNEEGELATTSAPVFGLRPRFTAADLDGDGDLDLVVPNTDGANWLLRNDGAVGFTRIDTAGLGQNSVVVVVGDVDQDGDLDLVSWNNEAGGATLSRNQGAASFVEEDVGPAGAWALGARLADFDGDHQPDVAFAMIDLKRWQGQANGGFVLTQSVTATTSFQTLDVGDLDGDGDLDLFTATKDVTGVYLNSGTFALGWSQDALEQVSQLVLGDLDGDGDLDAVAGGIFLNQ